MGNTIDSIESKYKQAFDLMAQLGIELKNVNMRGDQLFVKGNAPSQEAKNKVWDAVKAADPEYKDLILDLVVVITTPPPAPEPQPRTYKVEKGDTLSKISKHFYGSPNEYMKIVEANQDVITDPNAIYPGQVLVIPE